MSWPLSLEWNRFVPAIELFGDSLPLQCGDTFLIPKSAKAIEHLWVIVTEVDPVTNNAICVNVTSKQSHSDTTVVLVAGDHRFIRHDSVIMYADAREMRIDLVEQALSKPTNQFVCQAHDPCTPALLERIRQGLLASKQTPKGIKKKCKDLWGTR